MARILIGTSGWHYDSWRGPFFPKGLPLKNQLQYYASQFSTTELNGVFYRTPTPKSVRSWRDQTGDDFVFAWKASKFITRPSRESRLHQTAVEEAPLQLRVSSSELVCAAHPEAAIAPQHLALHLRSSRRARAVEAYGRLRLCQGARSSGTIQRTLQPSRSGWMGHADQVLEEARLRRFRLFR